MKRLVFFIFMAFSINLTVAQLPDECKLAIGTNVGGLSDYGTEIAFVDMMKSCRVWYSKSVGDPNNPFDSGFSNQLTYRSDGYPTHLPQTIDGSIYPQRVATIWAITSGWISGQYVLLWDGTGDFNFWGSFDSYEQTEAGRIVIHFSNTFEGVLEMTILNSDANNPVRNVRLLMPGSESTYQTQPFSNLWLEKLAPFKTIRFMDWGQTNNWGQVDNWTIAGNTLVDWTERSQPDYYTYTHSKGVPYEYMVKLMNDQNKDGWVCVPHTASENYVRNMAAYFRDNLEPERHIYIEYSNEVWNWMFGQTQWLNKYGCVNTGTAWPEGIVPYIQNVMDYWTDEFSDHLNRTSRVVGIQTGWLDVAERVVNNLNPNSFDLISPTYYFNFSEAADQALDLIGTNATVADVAFWARENMPSSFASIQSIKNLATNLNKDIAFYEGGQHLTPTPFGEEPTYAQALMDIQRDTAMYNLYNEWYDKLRSLQQGSEPLFLMNFSFVSGRSAQYGSWGILETLDQDTLFIPAPKYKATLENMNYSCYPNSIDNNSNSTGDFLIYPNPTDGFVTISFAGNDNLKNIRITDINGKSIINKTMSVNSETVNFSDFPSGVYIINIQTNEKLFFYKLIKQ